MPFDASQVWNGDATATIAVGGATIVSGYGECEISWEPVKRELLCQQNTPYPAKAKIRDIYKGKCNLYLDKTEAFVNMASDTVTLTITADGVYYTGTVEITSFAVQWDADPTKVATGSFTWESTTGTNTFAKSAA